MGITSLNDFSSAWAACLWKASWQGGLALLLVFLLTVLVRRIPAQFRCWLWRLAFLKLLVAGCWIVPIELHWLPAVEVQTMPGPQAATVLLPLPAAQHGSDEREFANAASITPDASISAQQAPSPVSRPQFSRWSWLLIAWSCGVLVGLTNLLRQWLAVRKMLLSLAPVTNASVLDAVREACQRLGISRLPAVRVSNDSGAPCLMGIVRPVIVLPSTILESCSAEALNAALTHELAHVKRQDLLWNWLPALAEVLFYFHPLVWLARREWRLAQEIATDELAVTASQFDPAQYAGLLLELVAQCRPSAIRPHLVVGVSETYTQLSRRMAAMLTFQKLTWRRRMIATAVVLVIAILGLVPWKLAHREIQAQESRIAQTESGLPTKSQKAVVEAIEKLGGDVVYDQKSPNDVVIAVSFFKKPITDADLADLKVLTGLRAVTLDDTKITDAGLAHLKGITTLGAVDLNETQVTDKGLAYLTGLPKLEQLGLIGTPVTDKGLPHLKGLKEMVMLLLGRTKITDNGLVNLKDFPKLKTLALDGTSITDAGLEHLQGLKELLDLRLNETRVKGPGLQHLQQMTKLRTLVLNGTKLTDEGLSHLGKLRSLETLWLVNTELTDAGLVHLKGLSNLRALNLEGNAQITEQAGKELRTRLGKCQVTWSHTASKETAKDHPHEHIVQPPPDARLLTLSLEKQVCELMPPIWAMRPVDSGRGMIGNSRRPFILDDQRFLWHGQILRLATGERQSDIAFGKDEFVRTPVAISQDRRFLLLQCQSGRTNAFSVDLSEWYQVWDIAGQKLAGTHIAPVDFGTESYLTKADLTADGKFVAAANEQEGEVSVWDVASSSQVKRLPVKLERFAKGYQGRAPFFRPEFLRFSPDGKWLVVFTPNRVLYWKWQTHEEPVVIELGRRLEAFAFSPDSRYVAEGPGPRENIQIRDMNTLQVVRAVDDGAKHSMITSGLTFTSDGLTLIACNSVTVNENKLKIPHRLHFWEVATGKLIRQLAMPIYRPRYLDLSPDGRYLVAYLESNADTVLAAWDVKELDKLPRLK